MQRTTSPRTSERVGSRSRRGLCPSPAAMVNGKPHHTGVRSAPSVSRLCIAWPLAATQISFLGFVNVLSDPESLTGHGAMRESHVTRTNPSAARASASAVLDLGLRGQGSMGQDGVGLGDVSCCFLLIVWICRLAGWMHSRWRAGSRYVALARKRRAIV
jgi:hypothetical protein